MKSTLFGLILLSSMAFSAPSWTDAENLEIYWFEADGTELERGSDVRGSSDTTGTATITEEELDRASKLWVSPDDGYYLNTSDGTWL